MKTLKILISVLIGSIVIGIISLIIIFTSRKENSSAPKESPVPEKRENLPLPEENSKCPYLNEANLFNSTTFDPQKMSASDEELAQ